MSEIKNLWSKDLLKDDDSLLPVTILQEQARYLNEMTKNIVIAKVSTQQIALSSKINETKRGILHSLQIVAPAIGNYDFELVRVVQEQLLPYPLKVSSPLTEERYGANNSKDLEDALVLVFNNPKTIAALQSLIMQSKPQINHFNY